MYIETSYNRFGDRARLGSPILKGSCTLRMFYHMYGQHVNALVVYMRTTTNGPLQRKVNMSGNIGDNWIRAEVPVTNGNQPFQVVIEGKLNYISEFAATGTTKCVLAVSPLQQFQIFFLKKKTFYIVCCCKNGYRCQFSKSKINTTLGTRGFFSCATRSFVGHRPKTRAAKPREKNRQGTNQQNIQILDVLVYVGL